MEHGYGIGITNRYSCFLENEDDPTEALKLVETDKDSKKKGGKSAAEKENRKETAAETPKIATAPAQSQSQRKGIRDSNVKGASTNEQQQRPNRYQNDSGERGNRGPRPERQNTEYVDRRPRPAGDDREERNNRRNQDDQQNREYRDGGDYRGGMRRGGYRGSRGGGGVPFRGGRGNGTGTFRKREFDRQSGSDKSGVKPIDKRDGAGSRNWGTYKDDVLEEGTTTVSAEESMEEKPELTNANAEGENPDAEKTADGEVPPPEGEETKLMTLGEWKALQEQQKQARPKPVFNLRKAGEGEDQSQWKKMTLKTKEKEENQDEEEEEGEVEEYDYPQRAGRQKQLLDINFHFADSRRGMTQNYSGPPRGDSRSRPRRGTEADRGRGGGGRGGDGGGRGEGQGGFRGEGQGGSRGEGQGGFRGEGQGGFGGPRGGGGGFRGGFRGGYRGYSNRDDRPTRQMAPKVDDERDFPSLG